MVISLRVNKLLPEGSSPAGKMVSNLLWPCRCLAQGIVRQGPADHRPAAVLSPAREGRFRSPGPVLLLVLAVVQGKLPALVREEVLPAVVPVAMAPVPPVDSRLVPAPRPWEILRLRN